MKNKIHPLQITTTNVPPPNQDMNNCKTNLITTNKEKNSVTTQDISFPHTKFAYGQNLSKTLPNQ